MTTGSSSETALAGSGDISADVAVVGAGIVGLAAGRALAVRHPRLLRELADRRRADRAFLAPLAGLIAEWCRAGYAHYTSEEHDG